MTNKTKPKTIMEDPKTARQWFIELEDPYKSQALKNLELFHFPNFIESKKYSTASSALADTFNWYATPEDGEYWGKLCDQLISENK